MQPNRVGILPDILIDVHPIDSLRAPHPFLLPVHENRHELLPPLFAGPPLCCCQFSLRLPHTYSLRLPAFRTQAGLGDGVLRESGTVRPLCTHATSSRKSASSRMSFIKPPKRWSVSSLTSSTNKPRSSAGSRMQSGLSKLMAQPKSLGVVAVAAVGSGRLLGRHRGTTVLSKKIAYRHAMIPKRTVAKSTATD